MTDFLETHPAAEPHHIRFDGEDVLAMKGNLKSCGIPSLVTGGRTTAYRQVPIVFLHPKGTPGTMAEVDAMQVRPGVSAPG